MRRLAEAAILHVGAPDRRYPGGLAELHDPPFGLFARGSVERAVAAIAGAPVVAIVGSRRATAQGRASRAGSPAGLAERGAVIVSGLAHGIDAAAHEGALAAGGTTVAVLGCGVNVPYPRRNRDLGAAGRRARGAGVRVLARHGARPVAVPGAQPDRGGARPGGGRRRGRAALGGADHRRLRASSWGGPVLAVPGWPGALASEGCNGLLRAGAALLEGPDDVVAEIAGGRLERRGAGGRRRRSDGLGGRIHGLLQREPMGADRLAERAGRGGGGGRRRRWRCSRSRALAVRGEGQRFWAAPLRAPPPGRPAAGFEG